MPAAPCIQDVPAGNNGGSSRCSTNRQRDPASSLIIRSSSASPHPDRSCHQLGRSGWVVAVLRRIKHRVTRPRGAATTAIVVPEARIEPSGDTGGQYRVEAATPKIHAVNLGRPGVIKGSEQVRGADRPVTPGKGHRVHCAGGQRHGVRYDKSLWIL